MARCTVGAEKTVDLAEISTIGRFLLYTEGLKAVIRVMTDIFHFQGRGTREIASDRIILIESDEGSVLGITVRYGQAEFMVGYCRKALAERWGIYCDNLFRRASSPDLSRSWADQVTEGAFIFRSVRLHLAREEEWMRLSR
ncbi:MAG: hypothetical protein RLZZ398_204 [Verrucomicrobiota bacterium]|jgi:hypothetical protein